MHKIWRIIGRDCRCEHDDIANQMFQLHSFKMNVKQTLIGLSGIRFRIVCLLRVNSNYCIASQVKRPRESVVVVRRMLEKLFWFNCQNAKGQTNIPFSLFWMLPMYEHTRLESTIQPNTYTRIARHMYTKTNAHTCTDHKWSSPDTNAHINIGKDTIFN